MVRHGTASERLSQSRYRWTVSDPGLMIYIDHTQSAGLDGHDPALLVVHIGASIVTDPFAAVNQFTLGIVLDETLVPRVLDQTGNAGKRKVPVFFFPFAPLAQSDPSLMG